MSLVFSSGAFGSPATPIIEWNGVRIGTLFIEIRSGFFGSSALMPLGT